MFLHFKNLKDGTVPILFIENKQQTCENEYNAWLSAGREVKAQGFWSNEDYKELPHHQTYLSIYSFVFLEPSYVQEVPDVKFLTWLLFARPMLFQLSWLWIFLLSVTHELSVITTFDDVVFISIRR